MATRAGRSDVVVIKAGWYPRSFQMTVITFSISLDMAGILAGRYAAVVTT